MPANLVCLRATADPAQVALLGSAVARLGGLLVVRDHPTSADVDQALAKLQLQPDEILLAITGGGASTLWAVIVVTAVLGLAALLPLALLPLAGGQAPPPGRRSTASRCGVEMM